MTQDRSSEGLRQTERSQLRRKSARGRYDWETVVAILDEALICHVGFAVDGRPWVVPTAYGRVGHDMYLHGAAGNFALRALTAGADACVTVTLLDGLVLARSAFHHSMNYRSVVLFGRAERRRRRRREAGGSAGHRRPHGERSKRGHAPADGEGSPSGRWSTTSAGGEDRRDYRW